MRSQRLLGWMARRVPVADPAHRDEFVGSMAWVARERRGLEQASEAASLVGLALRLWSRREGSDDARQMVRQGVYLAGILLALVASALAWASASGPASIAVAGLISLAAVLASGGFRKAAFVAAAAVVLVGTTVPASIWLTAVVALLIGDRFGARHCYYGLAAGLLAASTLAVVAVGLPEATLNSGVLTAMVVLPLFFLAVGWYDPRFAVAATVAWASRFFSTDVGQLVAAFRVLDDAALQLELVRWLVMAGAVVMAAQVSRTALRRTVAA